MLHNSVLTINLAYSTVKFVKRMSNEFICLGNRLMIAKSKIKCVVTPVDVVIQTLERPA